MPQTYTFGAQSVASLGPAVVNLLIKYTFLQVTIQISETDVLQLKSLANIDHLKAWFDNLNNEVIPTTSGITADNTRHHGHPFIQ